MPSFRFILLMRLIPASSRKRMFSDTLIVNNEATGTTLAVKSYARLSAIGIFRMSDQRWSFLLAFAALLWAAGTAFLFRKKETPAGTVSYGGLSYSPEDKCFCPLYSDAIPIDVDAMAGSFPFGIERRDMRPALAQESGCQRYALYLGETVETDS